MTIRHLTALMLLGAIALGGCDRQAPKTEEPAAGEAPPAEPGVISLEADSQRLIGLQTAIVGFAQVDATLSTTGEIASNADREAHVTTRVPGRVLSVRKGVGDWARTGETIAVLESVELGQAQAEYLQSEAKQDLASSTYERQRQLYADKLTAKKEVQAAANELRLARIDTERDANQLKLLGFTGDRIARLARNRQLDPTVPLLAPITGVVIAKHVTIGEVLEPNAAEPAFTLSDTSRLWINADVYEKDLARVHSGQEATITTAAYAGKVFRGHVSNISTGLEKESRTAKARIVVDNPDHKLKPEMFVNVKIALGSQQALMVPKAAVQEEDQKKLVFVPQGDDKFKETPIEVGAEYGGRLQVLSGLKAGDTVVTKGSYDLKAQARKGSFAGED